MNLNLTKQNLLFLARVIEFGMNADLKKEEDMLALMPAETREELNRLMGEMLKKGELAEFYADLNLIV